jgi:hypothetical protein
MSFLSTTVSGSLRASRALQQAARLTEAEKRANASKARTAEYEKELLKRCEASSKK